MRRRLVFKERFNVLVLCLIGTFLVLNCSAQELNLPVKIDRNFHLYLLVGQSNMAGRGALDTLGKERLKFSGFTICSRRVGTV